MRILWWATLLLLSGLVALFPLRSHELERDRTDPRPDLILVTIECLRAVPVGGERSMLGMLPVLDRLGTAGARFEQALATSDWTLPSLVSMMTGQQPGRHGVVVPDRGRRPSAKLLAEQLAAAGYDTAGFVCIAFLGPEKTLARGFQLFDDGGPDLTRDTKLLLRQTGIYPFANMSPLSSDARVLAAAASRWLSGPAVRPKFLWVHFMDPHFPYQARRPYYEMHLGGLDREAGDDLDDLALVESPRTTLSLWNLRRFQALYQSNVSYTDHALGELLGGVDMSKSLVVVTGDHGEQLKENGWFGHGIGCSRMELHVPLVMAGRSVPPGLVVSSPVSLADVRPTLAHAAGLDEDQASCDGGPLQRWFDPATAPAARPIHSDNQTTPQGVWSLLEDGKHMLLSVAGPDSARVFDWHNDPLERRDVFDLSNPAHQRMRARLLEYARSMRVPLQHAAEGLSSLDPRKLRELRALGYLR